MRLKIIFTIALHFEIFTICNLAELYSALPLKGIFCLLRLLHSEYHRFDGHTLLNTAERLTMEILPILLVLRLLFFGLRFQNRMLFYLVEFLLAVPKLEIKCYFFVYIY